MPSLCLILDQPLPVNFKIQMKRQPMNYRQRSKAGIIELIMLKWTGESQLANLKIHNPPNILDEITQFISLFHWEKEVDFVYHLLIKLLESFSTFCNTISLLPSTHNMSKFVAMLQDRVTRKKSPQTSNETLLHAISKGKEQCQEVFYFDWK